MTCLPITQWYLYSEDDEPLDSLYRNAIPEVGATIDDRPNSGPVQIVSVNELHSTCAMRRFRVVVRSLG